VHDDFRNLREDERDIFGFPPGSKTAEPDPYIIETSREISKFLDRASWSSSEHDVPPRR
jgi:hypothetical protein